jgi:hypothetical protein
MDTFRLMHEAQSRLNLRSRTKEHPLGMMLAAAGVGYVLAGGLLTPLTGKLVKLGLRLSVLPLLQEEWGALAQTAADAGIFEGSYQKQAGSQDKPEAGPDEMYE